MLFDVLHSFLTFYVYDLDHCKQFQIRVVFLLGSKQLAVGRASTAVTTATDTDWILRHHQLRLLRLNTDFHIFTNQLLSRGLCLFKF